jgi:hypothetical protein
MTSKIVLSSSLLALFVAGCTQGGSSSTSQKLATAGATRSHGDLTPTTLVPASITAPTKGAVLHGSDALAPRNTFVADSVAEPVSTRMFRRTMSGTNPATYTFPIDNPIGARVLVRPVSSATVLTGIHMHSVATGLRLDHARDATNTDLGAKGVAPAPGDAVQREPGFAPLIATRVLSFDEPTLPGLVQLDVPAAIAAAGVVIEVDQPNTHLSCSGQADELAHTFGDQASLTFALANEATPIDGARVSVWAELPDHEAMPEVVFSSSGRGQYSASIPLSYADPKYIGAWGLHVKATGSVNGVAFERDVEVGFGYWPAHARMSWVGTPQVLRGTDGLIDEVSVDVGVETLADDQLSVRGQLTFTGTDGLEHTLAGAQTGQVVTHEGGTMTLHFDAASMVYANVNGPFHVRDLALVSQGTGTTQSRIGRGLDMLTDKITVEQLRMPMSVPLHVQDLIANGDLAAPTTK